MKEDSLFYFYLEEWQNIVDLIAKIAKVKSAAITEVLEPDSIVALKVSRNSDNPLHEGLKVKLANHYCEAVIEKMEKVHVPNAKNSERWCNSPEQKYHLMAYLGFPLILPNGNIFGTICIHDDKENKFSPEIEALMKAFKRVIEGHFELIDKTKTLKEKNLEIKVLKGLIPICAHCKKIRNDHGYWEHLETFLQAHTEANFSHGICPDCGKKFYPDIQLYPDSNE